MHTRLIPLGAVAALAGGCAVTGFGDSASKFACKAPDGVSCTSVSGVYANAQQNNLPALQPPGSSAAPSDAWPLSSAVLPLAAPGVPIRSEARMMRIWLAPWRDDDDTLHDQSYLYLVLDPGSWLIEHSRAATVGKSMARLQPPSPQRVSNSPTEGAAIQQTLSAAPSRLHAELAAKASAQPTAPVPDAPEDEK